MSFMESLPGLSRFADAEDASVEARERRKAEEDARIKRLWHSLINPAPKRLSREPLGPIGSGADILPFPALPDRAAAYEAQQTADSSCDAPGFVAGPKR